MRRQSLNSKKEPTEDVFFSRLFCIGKSDVRLGDKETIDFETAGTDGRYQTSEVRLREDTLVRNLKSKVFKSY